VVDHDPGKARRLLAEAGHPGGAGFPALAIKMSDDGMRILAEAMQQSWQEELGLHIAIAPEESKTLLDDLGTRNYRLAGFRFFYGVNAPETMLMVPLSDSQYNYSGWRSSAFDRAFDRAGRAETAASRRSCLDEMEAIVQAEAPLSPLYFVNQTFLVSSQVKGWRDNPLGQVDWRELWLVP
jgi:oligopeptide transport system substrate-binding protein